MGKVVPLFTPLTRDAIVTELAEIRLLQDEYRVAYDEMLNTMEEEGLLHAKLFTLEEGTLEYDQVEATLATVKDRFAGIQLRMSELRTTTATRYDDYRRRWGLI